jgi:hypothetical protein
MTPANLEDAERIKVELLAIELEAIAMAIDSKEVQGLNSVDRSELVSAAALLRQIPELNKERLLLGRMLDLQTLETSKLRQQLSEREWRPIETAPRDGSFFLGFPVSSFMNGEKVELWATVRWSTIEDAWVPIRSNHRPKLTHWQPLPGATK